MGKILYEVQFEFSMVYLVPLIIFTILFFIIKSHEKRKIESAISEQEKTNIRYTAKVFKKLAAGLFSFIFIGIVCLMATQYIEIMGAYKYGNYKVVEGEIQNFVPMPYDGHSFETFNINGIEFKYTDYSEAVGYKTTLSHGGVIKGNGQYLRIRYVPYKDFNQIVYIEEK